MSSFGHKITPLLLGVALIVTLSTQAAKSLGSNLGMLRLVRAVTQQEQMIAGEYPIDKNSRELRAASIFGENGPGTVQALIPIPESWLGRWTLARLALWVGDYSLAARTLTPVATTGSRNPLLFLDAMVALSYTGQQHKVIDLFERSTELPDSQFVRDLLALAYIERGGPDDLSAAYRLRPDDLYLNFRLWSAAAANARQYEDYLARFSSRGILPLSYRYLRYTLEAIDELVKRGLWRDEQAVSALSALVWKRSHSAALLNYLEAGIEREPQNDSWRRLLSELYYRLGQCDAAVALYGGLRETYLTPTVVFRRSILEESCRGDQAKPLAKAAASAFSLGYQLLNLDPVDSNTSLTRRLQESQDMYSALDGPSFQALARQVAQASELPVADVDFDNCLVYDFEHPDLWFDGRWRFGSSLNAEGSASAFVTGIDALSFRGHGVRMESLWPVDETASGVPNNDLFTLGLPPLEGWHVVSVFYRASGMSDSDGRVIGNGWLYWGDWPSTTGHAFMETRLPDSHGQWKRVLGITYIPETPAPDQARFVLRLWGTGRIEYDELRICSFPETEPPPASDCSAGCQFVSITP